MEYNSHFYKNFLFHFVLFQSFVKKNDVDGKMLNALLTGVNRAYPYAKCVYFNDHFDL